MKAEPQSFIDRPKRYAHVDGTAEMVFGVMALGFGLLGYLQAVLPEDSMWRLGSGMLLFWGILLPMFGLILWIPKAIKKRVTWPRTGYVKYRPVGGKSRWIVIAATAAVSAVLAASVVCLMRFDPRHNWMGLVSIANPLIYVAGYAFWIYRFGGEQPWKWLVLLFMALGFLAIALSAPADLAGVWQLTLLFVGLTWLGSGGATLCLYVRHNPLPAPEAE